MTQDPRVLEEIIVIKDQSLKIKDDLFRRLSIQLRIELNDIENLLQKKVFFPPVIIKKIQDLKQLIKIAQ